MSQELTTYLIYLVVIVVGIIILKKLAGCIIRTVITIAILAILIAIYYGLNT